MTDRHSEIDEPELISDPEKKAFAEARNALRQFDIGMVLLDHWLDNGGRPPNLRISDLLTLNRFALEDVNKYAGTFRTQPVKIVGSNHIPPPAKEVPILTEDFCDYINQNWDNRSAIHLSAYALWRINWIHPFVDGNGRTARTISYVILCAKYKHRIRGINTIPEQIATDKKSYYLALEHADELFKSGVIVVSKVEDLIENSLRKQLEGALLEPQVTTQNDTNSHENEKEELLITEIPTTKNMTLTLRVENSLSRGNFIEKNPVIWTGFFTIAGAVVSFLLTKIF